MSTVVWRLLGRYLPHRGRRFSSLGLVSALTSLLEAAVLVLVVRAAVAITDGESEIALSAPGIGDRTVSIPTVLAWAVVLGLLSAGAGLLVARMTARASAAMLGATRSAALRAFSRATWNVQASTREGALQEVVSNNSMQAAELATFLARGLSGVIALAVFVAVALMVHALVTLAIVTLGLLVLAVVRPITTATRRRASRFVRSNSNFSETVAEASGLALEMRVFGVETAEAERLVGVSGQAADQAFLARFASNAGATVYRNVAVLFLVAAVGGLYAIGDIDLSAVGAVILLMVRALSYAQQTQWSVQRVNELSPNLVTLDAKIAEFERSQERFGATTVDHIDAVSLRAVSYSYSDQPALQDMDLDLEPGELLGVVGPSGGGKSTLVQVLLRLRTPTTGSVVVNGIPYEQIEPANWATLVSVVPQEPRMFAGTVAENIAFHRPGLSRDEIVEAATRAHVAEEIERLPGGFDHDIGARGGGLSGGQKQRLAIARALVSKPELLVLDEPTSALDIHSERALSDTIADLGGEVTTVIVAHRLSTISACDRLLVLENGRVTALGSYAEVKQHPFLSRSAVAGAADSNPLAASHAIEGKNRESA